MAHRKPWGWIVGIVVLVLIAFITWVGTRPDARPARVAGMRPIAGTSVMVIAPPANTRVGVPVSFAWTVAAPVGSSATHTAIHWGPSSRAGTLGAEVGPVAAGYANMLADYAQGSFALPRSFTGAITFPGRARMYYRAHAVIGGKNIWSPEYVIVVE